MLRASLCLLACMIASETMQLSCSAMEPALEGVSSREVRLQAARSLPLSRFSGQTQKALRDVVNNPSFFRRMPSQEIACDPQMLQFLVRRPEVLVNIWDLMGITKVSADRLSNTSFVADDGVGTQCRCDLVFSNKQMHVYYGSGDYSGSMTPRRVKGRCVCILHTREQPSKHGPPVVIGTMDVFLKLDNFGADILTRTLAPFVGQTADHNFVETAKFVGQISQLCVSSPAAMQGLAMRLGNVDDSVRQEFAGLAARIAATNSQLSAQSEQVARYGTLPLANQSQTARLAQAGEQNSTSRSKPVAIAGSRLGLSDRTVSSGKGDGSAADPKSETFDYFADSQQQEQETSLLLSDSSGEDEDADLASNASTTDKAPTGTIRWVRPRKTKAVMRR